MSADSAFPTKYIAVMDGIPTPVEEGGLTKREYFAGLAMQATLSSHERLLNYDRYQKEIFKTTDLKLHEMVAIAAVQYADALIKALEREKEK